MASSSLLDKFMPPLLAGDRAVCRSIVQKELARTKVANDLYTDFLWPAMDRVEKLFRGDRINSASEHMATRITRSIADQLQPHLRVKPPDGKRMILLCAEGEPEELGAQMTADLFEARGWTVYFLGSGIPNDEVLSLIGAHASSHSGASRFLPGWGVEGLELFSGVQCQSAREVCPAPIQYDFSDQKCSWPKANWLDRACLQ